MNDPRFFAGAFLFLSIVVVVYFGLFPTWEDIQDRGEERAIVEEAFGPLSGKVVLLMRS